MSPYLQRALIAVGVVAVLVAVLFVCVVQLAHNEPWSET